MKTAEVMSVTIDRGKGTLSAYVQTSEGHETVSVRTDTGKTPWLQHLWIVLTELYKEDRLDA